MKATFENVNIGTKINFADSVLTITELDRKRKFAVARWQSGGELFIFGDTHMNGLTIAEGE